MKNQKAELLGIDESLSGNERNIISCFPVIRVGQSEIASVRKLEWESETRKGMNVFKDEEEARKVVTLFDDCEPVQVSNNEMIMLVGPDFESNLVCVTQAGRLFTYYFYHGLVNTHQSGFYVKCVEVNTYSLICSGLVFASLSFFDLRVKTGEFVPDHIGNALRVIEGIGNVKLEKEYYIRKLLYLGKIWPDRDAYEEYMTFAIQDLEMPREEVETLVDEYAKSLDFRRWPQKP